MEAQVALRPSSTTKPRRTKRDRPLGVELMAKRHAHGQSIWTGRQLRGRGAQHWLRLAVGLGENESWGGTVLSIDAVTVEDPLVTITFTLTTKSGTGQKTICVEVKEEGTDREEKVVRLVG